jgi:hypothetical protein
MDKKDSLDLVQFQIKKGFNFLDEKLGITKLDDNKALKQLLETVSTSSAYGHQIKIHLFRRFLKNIQDKVSYISVAALAFSFLTGVFTLQIYYYFSSGLTIEPSKVVDIPTISKQKSVELDIKTPSLKDAVSLSSTRPDRIIVAEDRDALNALTLISMVSQFEGEIKVTIGRQELKVRLYLPNSKNDEVIAVRKYLGLEPEAYGPITVIYKISLEDVR